MKRIPEGTTHTNNKRKHYKWCYDDGLFKWNYKNDSWWWISYYKEDFLKELITVDNK